MYRQYLAGRTVIESRIFQDRHEQKWKRCQQSHAPDTEHYGQGAWLITQQERPEGPTDGVVALARDDQDGQCRGMEDAVLQHRHQFTWR